MKTVLLIFFLCTTALANTIDLNIDLTSKIKFLNYTKVVAQYESTLRSCTSSSKDILSDRSPKFFQKVLPLIGGVYKGQIDLTMIKCSAKLISIKLVTKLDRQALAREFGLHMSDIDKKRQIFSFHIFRPRTEQRIFKPQLAFEKLYVAGRTQPMVILYSRALVAPIINEVIDLVL